MTETYDDNIIDCEFAYINSPNAEGVNKRQSPHSGLNPKIAVVEDNQLILNHLVRTLENAGYDVFGFEDAESAIPLFKERGKEIAVAIIDDILPKLHGQELIKAVKDFIPNTKIILTSGYYSDDCRVPIMDPQPLIFIHKPYRVENLLEKVKAFAPLVKIHERN
jgi:DNA-binding NtrC family response regulator